MKKEIKRENWSGLSDKEVMRYYSDTFLIILFADIRTTLFLTNFITVTKV